MSFSTRIILLGKALFSFFEIFVGSFSLLFGYHSIRSIIQFLAGLELKEDQNDRIALFIIKISENISIEASTLISLYLICEGILKIYLLYGIYTKKKSVFKISFLFFLLLTLYEIYLLGTGHSLLIIFPILLDILLLWIIKKEYRNL